MSVEICVENVNFMKIWLNKEGFRSPWVFHFYFSIVVVKIGRGMCKDKLLDFFCRPAFLGKAIELYNL